MSEQIPDGFVLARTTPTFDNDTVPAGLLSAHRVADGIWGRLIVHSGEVGFVFEDDADTRNTIAASGSITIPPGRPHHVVLDQPATFAVEFYRPPATQAAPAGTESTGLDPQRSIIAQTSGDDLHRPSDSSSTDAPAISLRGLSKSFSGRVAVGDLSFDLARGTVTGFVGPNGAGKSTTIRMLLGLIQPSAGTAAVLGHPISNPHAYLCRVGALVEAPAFYPQLSGYRNLLALTRLARLPPERIDEVLVTAGLADRGDDRYRDYSLGMKQRLGIAAALLQDPELLILDEPTNGLDPAGIVEIRTLLRELSERGTSVLVSSHNLSEIQAVCHGIVLIQHGRLLWSGPIDELLAGHGATLVVAPEHAHDVEVLAGVVTAAGYRSTTRDDYLEIRAPGSWAADLNRLAMAAGITLRELTMRDANLEQTFLDLTGTGEQP